MKTDIIGKALATRESMRKREAHSRNHLYHSYGQPVYIPRFVDKDGNAGPIHGFSREVDDGFDRPDYIENFRFWTKDGDYYAIGLDTREKSRRKTPSLYVGSRAFYFGVRGYYTIHAKVDPATGHTLQK
jgi:hypothetical protein